MQGLCDSTALAADMRPSLEDDDDDEAAKPVSALPSSALTPPDRNADLSRIMFDNLAVRHWNAELGVRQRWVSRQGKRRGIEGATGLIFDLSWRDTFFLSSDRGLGANILSLRNVISGSDRFAAGVSLSFDEKESRERSQSQSRSVDAKRGTSTFILGFAEYSIARWKLWTELAHFVGSDKGNVVSLGLEYRLPLTTKWSTTFATGFSLADGQYMRQNYSVPYIASLGRRPLFVQPKAGLRDVTVSADFEYVADRHWRWNTQIGFTKSLVVIPQGTWVKVRSEPFISTSVRYRF
jgi:outer membrane scaffolding protein for murein synthesis (MipA/OmpV family)